MVNNNNIIIINQCRFVSRTECIEVAAEDILCGKGYELTLFLFTDILLIAKRKTGRMGGMMRSPSTTSVASGQVPIHSKVNAGRSFPYIHG